MKTRKNLSLILIGLLLSTCSYGQLFSWSGIPGQPTTKTFTLQSSWTGTVTITAYYSEGGPKVPDRFQPTFFRQINTLSAQFSAQATSALPKSIFVAVATGSTVRFRGYLVLSATSLTLNPNGLDAVLASKVDKAVGKSLTSNDFSNSYKAKLDSLSYLWSVLALKGDAFLGGDNTFTGANVFNPTIEGPNMAGLDIQPYVGLADATNPAGLRINMQTFGSAIDATPVSLLELKMNGTTRLAVDSVGMIKASNLSLKSASVSADFAVPLDVAIVYANASTASLSVILPNVETVVGRIFTVKRLNSGSNVVYVSSYAGTFDGASYYTLSAQYKVVTVQATSSGYMVIGNN